MPVRMKDIARELGISVVTVSKVLRNHPDIGEHTRNRVLKRMRELNYQPNLAARSLSTGRTMSIGLVVPDLLHPFFARIAAIVSAQLRKQNYGIVISSSEDDPELERQEIEQLIARQVDVLLIASAQRSPRSFAYIEQQRVPYVLIDRAIAGLKASFVGIDDTAAGVLATRHLIEQGCRRIAHIRGPDVSTAVGRLEGYRSALAAAHRKPLAGHIVTVGSSADHRGERGGHACMRELLNHKSRPDGIFCFNDPIAMGAMWAILEAGLRIPEDIAVVGCGNLSYSDFLRIPLSSIDQDSQQLGERAAEIALQLARGAKQTRPKCKIIAPTLVVRASSLRIRA
jgi:LacI family transcriptional regulator